MAWELECCWDSFIWYGWLAGWWLLLFPQVSGPQWLGARLWPMVVIVGRSSDGSTRRKREKKAGGGQANTRPGHVRDFRVARGARFSVVEKGGTSRNGRAHTTLFTAITRQAPLAHRRPGQTRDKQIAERPAQCHMSLRRGLERCVARCVVLGVHSACSTGCPTASMWWGLSPDSPGRACPWMGTSRHGMDVVPLQPLLLTGSSSSSSSSTGTSIMSLRACAPALHLARLHRATDASMIHPSLPPTTAPSSHDPSTPPRFAVRYLPNLRAGAC